MRLRNDPLAHEKLEKSGFLITKFPFKVNDNTIIELGMGKGEMITQLAFLNPDKTYIGIEKFATVAAKAANRAKQLNLKNFFIICEDVINLPTLLSGNVATIWLTFSDPWPKAHHERRRLTYKDYLNIYKQVLSTDGMIRFKTDNDKLFAYSCESFVNNGFVTSNVTNDLHKSNIADNIPTGYETKWSSLGKNINYLEARVK